MRHPDTNHRRGLLPLILGLTLLGGCDNGAQSAASAPVTDDSPVSDTASSAAMPADTIATVGDQAITFSQLNTMLNSSAVVGLSIPALGTPERNQVIITLLDKAISANLLYLDAKAQGVDRDPEYLQGIRRFEDAVLASLYRDRHLYADIQVGEDEIREAFARTAKEGEEMTPEDHLAIEARLRNDKLNTLKTRLQSRIREGVSVKVEPDVLNPNRDEGRTDDAVAAHVDAREITWGEVKDLMRGADRQVEGVEFYLDSDTERLKRLDAYIDTVIMAVSARAAGLESDPVYLARTGEYRKTSLINLHRGRLLKGWSPSDEELRAFFEANRDRIIVPEMRKVQMVVLKTKDEAEEIKRRIEAGEMTLFQAARDHSIDPNASKTLGEIGWVSRGSGFPELDEFTFFQEPGLLGGPVQSPNGWHLVKVLDVQDAQMQYLEEPQAHHKTLRLYMTERLNNHVIDLRKSRFDVAVIEDELKRQFQHEAEYIAQLEQKAAEAGSMTAGRAADIREMLEKEQ